jgi:hypothetical protein
LQSPYAVDFINAKVELINSKSDDPRLIHIRRYLRTVNSLDFDAVPDYAALSHELSQIN